MNFLLKIIYNLTMFLLLPVAAILVKKQHQKPTKWYWRLGLVPKSDIAEKTHIWFHAASLGEINAAEPILQNLLEKENSILISTMTFTGFSRAKKLFPSASHIFIPLDFYLFALFFINKVKPEKIIFFETEIWANFWWIAKSKKIPFVVLNARISPSAFKNYKKFKFFFKSVLSCATKISTISDADAQRFKTLGAKNNRVETNGNIKLMAKRQSDSLQWAQDVKKQNPKLIEKKIFLAASTHSFEEKIILQVFSNLKNTNSNLILILVPRHPERFKEVENLILEIAKNKNYKFDKFSHTKTLNSNCDILLGDTLGDMHKFYAIADFVFVAGSLIKGIGGHNFLEAGAYLKPIISGKYLENFSEIAKVMQSRQALDIAENPQDLQKILQIFLQNKNLCLEKSKNLADFFSEQKFVLQNQLNAVENA